MKKLLLLLTVVTACSAEERRSPPPPVKAAPAPLADSTQTALVKELDDTMKTGNWSGLRRRWQGQGVRWNVIRQRVLCQSAEACNVAAFPIVRPAQQGWMPTLTFAPGQYAALESACATKEQCDVTIEGTLEKLEVSAEMPTNVRISDVRVVTKKDLTASN